VTSPRTSRSERGFTIVELLISTAIMLTVTGAIFSLMNPAQGSSQTQPEVADMQQRMRVAQEMLFKELVMAGAGPYQGATTGSLVNFFAPVIPRRTGRINPDPTQGSGSFKSNAITLAYIPNSYSQSTISQPMPPNSVELKVTQQSNCPKKDPLCGFETGMAVILFDSSGHFDNFTVTQTQSDAAHLQHRGQNWTHEYATGAQVTQIVTHTYYLNTTTNQLMRYDGDSIDIAIADNVVDLQFQYFGDPAIPLMPKPPLGTANCLYDAAGNFAAAMTVLTPLDGSFAELTPAMLSDGPYCGSGSNQFDADLLRIRKVRVLLRVQAASSSLRGTNTAIFKNPGSAIGGERYVPDYRVGFEVAPRNMNLAR
jgi:Tfp pilus assembly protein PilW